MKPDICHIAKVAGMRWRVEDIWGYRDVVSQAYADFLVRHGFEPFELN
jgi:hypothetical protein